MLCAAWLILAVAMRCPAGPEGPEASSRLPPKMVDLTDVKPVRDFVRTLEEPALHRLLQTVSSPEALASLKRLQDLPRPSAEHLIQRPDEYRGRLMSVTGQFWESRQIELLLPAAGQKAVRSVLLLEEGTGRPVQVIVPLAAGFPSPPRFTRIKAVGYFYKVRQDEPAAPDRAGRKQPVSVPVLVGIATIVGEPTASAVLEKFLPIWLGVVIAALGLLMARLFASQRKHWRARRDAHMRRLTH